jgi:hypothetical protein
MIGNQPFGIVDGIRKNLIYFAPPTWSNDQGETCNDEKVERVAIRSGMRNTVMIEPFQGAMRTPTMRHEAMPAAMLPCELPAITEAPSSDSMGTDGKINPADQNCHHLTDRDQSRGAIWTNRFP